MDLSAASLSLSVKTVGIITSGGDVVFIDTSGLEQEFLGEVKIGVQGQIMRILAIGLMVQ